MAYYLDTSALVKLVVVEDESEPLRQWLADEPRHPVSSDLARTELTRAVRRLAPHLVQNARAVLDALTLISASASVFEAAARLDPTELRSLDAVDLATALELGDDLDGVVTYDIRLADAAAALGLSVVAPR
jgi:predicted nucleic acid-binding protein